VADLTVGCFYWGTKYPTNYMARLKAGVERHLKQPHEFRMFFPEPEDLHLTEVAGCFARLRVFDPKWQEIHKITGRLVILDLDLIITGSLDGLFDRPEPFTILQGVNAANPCPYNGSVWMLQAGYRPDVWTDFSLEAAERVPYYAFADDQSWLAAKLPNSGAFGPDQGVYAFQKPGWPKGNALPKNARIVAFPGWRDPVGFQHLDWVKQHWVGL
jgi:hypothetical protein